MPAARAERRARERGEGREHDTTAGVTSQNTAAAAPTTSTARTASAPTITRLRGSRSASIDANGVTAAISSSRTTPQTPTAVTPPTPNAHTVTAVAYAQSPIRDPASARLTRRSPGLRNTIASESRVSRAAPVAALISSTP